MKRTETMSLAEYRNLATDNRRRNKNAGNSKYGSRFTEIDGHNFHSKKESCYYGLLKLRVRAGDLIRFEIQVEYLFIIKGKVIGKYVADFVEYFPDGRVVVVDVKSEITRQIPLYKLKKRLMLSLFGIEIIEK